MNYFSQVRSYVHTKICWQKSSIAFFRFSSTRSMMEIDWLVSRGLLYFDSSIIRCRIPDSTS
jgi:hypothetical protein